MKTVILRAPSIIKDYKWQSEIVGAIPPNDRSIIDAELVGALLALVEDGRALVDAPGLHDVVFHLGVVALGAPLLDDHLALPAPLAVPAADLVLVQPLLVLADGEFGPDDLAWIGGEAPANYWKLS